MRRYRRQGDIGAMALSYISPFLPAQDQPKEDFVMDDERLFTILFVGGFLVLPIILLIIGVLISL